MGTKPRPVEERFFAKVRKQGPSDCWLWTGATSDRGYGNIRVGGRRDGRTVLAHRLSYEMHVGPISGDLVIDHLCRVRHCVNPAHLEPVTSRENLLRGQHPAMVAWRTSTCYRGHSYTPAEGRCRTCAAAFQRNRRARLKAERLQATG